MQWGGIVKIKLTWSTQPEMGTRKSQEKVKAVGIIMDGHITHLVPTSPACQNTKWREKGPLLLKPLSSTCEVWVCSYNRVLLASYSLVLLASYSFAHLTVVPSLVVFHC